MALSILPTAALALMACVTGVQSPLVVPDPQQDLSAFRLDTEVFGWNREFTQVAAVAMEMARDTAGAHRGETYLLVYPIGSTLPVHNVICHYITHVALPDNPVPLEEAGDYMWTIENSYQNMWPRRPRRRRPLKGMRVTPLWAPMPLLPPATPDGAQTPAKAAHLARPTSAPPGATSCTPWVGFRMQHRGEVRLQPYAPMDMSARCELIRMDPATRTYWGHNELTASMVRFDFAPRPDNEESARFVVSAAWRRGRHIALQVAHGGALAPGLKANLAQVLKPWGSLRLQRADDPALPQEATGAIAPITVRAAPGWLPLARKLAAELGDPQAAYVADPSLGDTVHFALAAAGDEAIVQATDAAAKTPDAAPSEAAPPPPPPPKSPSPYLRDFKVP